MIKYGWGYYDDRAVKTIGEESETARKESARHYAALMKHSPYFEGSEEDLADDFPDEMTIPEKEKDVKFSSSKKSIKPKYFTYNMRTRKPYYETNPTRPSDAQHNPYYEYSKSNPSNTYSVRSGYEAFRARYGEDSPVPRPMSTPVRMTQVKEKGVANSAKLERAERSVKFTHESEKPRPDLKEPLRVRLLSVSPEPDLPKGGALVLRAEDPEVLQKKTRKKETIPRTVLPNDVYLTNGVTSWLAY